MSTYIGKYKEWCLEIHLPNCIHMSSLERGTQFGGWGCQRDFTHMLHVFWWGNAFMYSVQFSHSVVSNSLWLHGLQHTRIPCPSPTPTAWSNSCPLSRWCHPTISSSVGPFSSCFQCFPASESFPMRQLFALGGQSIGVSASVLPTNIQD